MGGRGRRGDKGRSEEACIPTGISALQLGLLATVSISGAGMAFAGFLLLGLGASGLATSLHLRSGSAWRPSAWWAGLVAGLRVGQACGMLLPPGFEVRYTYLT